MREQKEYSPYWQYLRSELRRGDHQYPKPRDVELLDEYLKSVQAIVTNRGGDLTLHEELMRKVEYLAAVFETHKVEMQVGAVFQIREFLVSRFLGDEKTINELTKPLSELFAIEDDTYAKAWTEPLIPPYDPKDKPRPRG